MGALGTRRKPIGRRTDPSVLRHAPVPIWLMIHIIWCQFLIIKQLQVIIKVRRTCLHNMIHTIPARHQYLISQRLQLIISIRRTCPAINTQSIFGLPQGL